MKDLTNEQISSIWHAQAASGGRSFEDIIRAAIKADRELNGRTGATAEQAKGQEAVANVTQFGIYRTMAGLNLPVGAKLYTTPPAQPAREWVVLDALEISAGTIEKRCGIAQGELPDVAFAKGARWAESKLREKNAGLPAAVPDDIPAILKKQAS